MYDVNNNFTYHAPTQEQQSKYVALRNKAKELAQLVIDACPDSRERALALTKVEESVMWANAAVARNE